MSIKKGLFVFWQFFWHPPILAYGSQAATRKTPSELSHQLDVIKQTDYITEAYETDENLVGKNSLL